MTKDANKMPSDSGDPLPIRLKGLQTLFPEVFVEGRIDFQKLKLVLGEAVDDGPERYGLTWAGKSDAIRAIQVPSIATLVSLRKESLDFDATANLMIEGDNLEVLKLLQKAYHGKIKMIYIDPPYNTGKEFIYPDNFREGLQDYLRYSGQVDGEGLKLSTNTETSGRFHSRWLTMMYPRLFLARNLLRDDGVMFISIDDHEVYNLRALANEVFGEENFVTELIWKSKSGGANDSRFVAVDHEYVLAYAKDASRLKFNLDKDATVTTSYNLRDEKGKYALDRLDKQNLGYVASLDFPITGPDGKTYTVFHKDPDNKAARWRWGKSTVAERYDELVFKDGCVYTKNYEKDGSIPRSLLIEERFGRTRTGKTDLEATLPGAPFDNPKPAKLIQFLAQIATRPGDIIFDYFAGSGTTGQAVMQLNTAEEGDRHFLLVQLPERMLAGNFSSIADVTTARLRAAATTLLKQREGRLGLKTAAVDLGFRVFRLTSSNFKTWRTPPDGKEELARQLELYADNLADSATSEDILYELMLKAGIQLTAPVEKLILGGQEVYSVADGMLFICLADPITEECLRAMMSKRPHMVICLDHAFRGNDQLLTNTALEMKSHGVEHFRTA